MNGLHIVIVPAWWPSPEQPFAGVFFGDFAKAFTVAGARVGVIYPNLVSLRHLDRRRSVPLVPRIIHEDLDGIPVVRIRGLHTSAGLPGVQMRRFRRWLRRGLDVYVGHHGAPDVLHAMCALPSGWACTRLQGINKTPVVITEHTGPASVFMKRRIGESFARAAFSAAASVVTVSNRNRDDLMSLEIDRDIDVCGVPVSDAFVTPTPPDTRTPGSPRALFVGRLVKEKGIREIMAATVLLRSQSTIKTIEWHFAGDGPLAGSLRKHFAEHLPHSHLRLHGPCERQVIVKLMVKSDFLVFPTHAETFGMAAAEALCMGLPVITTRGPACAEFINKHNGLLIDRKSPAALALALQRIITTPNMFKRSRIADRARSRFAASAVAEWYARLFLRIKKARIE